MQGVTFQGTGDIRVSDVPEPTILTPTDAIVRVTLAAICGSDLHIYNAGAAFGFDEGQRLGHEFIGTVEAVGSGGHGVQARRPRAVVMQWSPTVRARTARRTSPRHAGTGRSSAGLDAYGNTEVNRRAARPSSCVCPWPTERCSSCPRHSPAPSTR